MRSYVNALKILSEKFVMIDQQRKRYQFCVPINKDNPSRRPPIFICFSLNCHSSE